MSSLTGKDPKDTYKDLLQVSNSNSGIDATLRNVEDGEGTSSPLMLSEDSVEIESQLVLSVAEGTAPMSVTSTTTVTNLDSDTVDGSHAADFAGAEHTHLGEEINPKYIIGETYESGISSPNVRIKGGNSGARSHSGGYNVEFFNAIGAKRFFFLDYSQCTGAVVAIKWNSFNSGATDYFTEGVEWTAATSNNATAESLAHAINTYYESAYPSADTPYAQHSGATCYVAGDAQVYDIRLSSDIDDPEIMYPANAVNGGTYIRSLLSGDQSDEIALQLVYETDKKTSGNDTGLLVYQTDTSSPGTSLLIDAQVGGTSKFSISNVGDIQNLNTTTGSWGFGTLPLAAGYPAFGMYNSETEYLTGFTMGDDGSIEAYGGTRLGIAARARVTAAAFNATGMQIAAAPAVNVVTAGQLVFETDAGVGRSDAGVVKATEGSTGYGSFVANNITSRSVEPPRGTVTQVGTPGATTYHYIIQVIFKDGTQTHGYYWWPNDNTSTNTGNAVLDGTNYNHITWTAVPGAAKYNVFSYPTRGKIGSDLLVCEYDDQGATGDSTFDYTNNTGEITMIDNDGEKYFRVTRLAGGGGHTEMAIYGYTGKTAGYQHVFGMYAGTSSSEYIYTSDFHSCLLRTGNVNSGYLFHQYSDAAWTGNTAGWGHHTFSSYPSGSSGVQNAFVIRPTYNQSATAGSTDFLIYRTNTAVGSGTHYFIDAQVGGSSKFSVNDNGDIVSSMITRSSVWPNIWAPGKMFIKGANANTTNPYQPSGVFLLGGIGSGIFYVTDWSAITPGSTLTVNLIESDYGATTSYVITEGVDWDADTSNEATASSIKNAFDTKISDGSFSLLSGTYLDTTSVVILVKDSVIYQSGAHSSANGIEWVDPTTAGGTPAIIIGGGLNNLGGPSISGSPRFQQTLQVNNGSSVTGPTQPVSGKVYAGGYIVGQYGSGLNGLVGSESAGPNPEPLMVAGSHCKYDSTGTGGSVFIKPGDGSVNMRIIDYTALTGKTITVTEYSIWNEDITYTITEGVDFDAEVDEVTTAANIVTALNNNYWYNEAVQTSGMPNIHWDREQALADGGFGILSVTSNADPALFVITNEDRGTVMVDGHLRFVDWENPDGNELHTDVGLQRASRMVLQVTNGGDGGVTTSGSLKTSTVYNEYSNWIGEQRTGSTDATVGVLSGQTPGTTAPIAAGGDVHLMGGIGKKTIQVVDYSHGSMANSTITVTENGTPVVLTEGSEWDSLTSNDYTATSIANAINMNCSYVFTAEASGAYVYIADMHDVVSGELRTLKIAKSANDAGMTVIDGRQGNMSVEHLMQAASGDEVAFEINYEVDKAAGNDTGLLISQTDTSSPGTSDQIRTESDGNWHFRADNTGRIYVSGTNNAIWASIYGGEGGIYIGGSSGGNLRFDTQHLGPFYDTYRADSSGIDLGATYPICWASAAGLFSLDTLDTGLVRASAGVVKFTNGSTGYGSTSMSNLTLTALSTPDAPVITNGGTPGATAYSYKVVAKLADGSKTLASSAGSTATGNATLDADNYNIITWSAVTGAHTYDVYRSASAGNPASTGLLFTSVSSPQHDHGEAAVGAEPTANTTGVIDGPNFDVTNSGVVSAAAFKAQTSAYFMPYINGSYMDAYDTNDIRFRLGANGRLYIDGDLGIDMATGTQLTWESAAGSSPASRDIGLARIAAGVLKVTDASTGAGTISAAGLNVGAYTAVSDGKIAQTVALNDATGNEYAQVHTITVNKLTSGEAGGIRMDITDTASPDRIAALDVYRGGDRECLINTGADNYPSMYVKWYTKMSGGWACFTADTQADSGKYCTMFANGTATSGALAAGDVGIMSKGNGNKGFKFMDDQVGGYTYAPIVTYAVRLGEKGGSDLVDAGIMRYGTGVARIFTGDLNSISTGKLMVTDLVAPDGSPDALTIANDGNLTANVSLTVAASAKVVWDTNVYEYADTVTLTDESDTPIFEIAIADGDMIGGKFSYTICASDGTDHQAISGDASFAAVRKAGTPETYHVDIDEHLGTDSTAVSTGTLTDAFSIAGASGKITVGCTANSSLAGATITLRYKLTLHSSKAVTKKT